MGLLGAQMNDLQLKYDYKDKCGCKQYDAYAYIKGI
jgi:hypothetical protein